MKKLAVALLLTAFASGSAFAASTTNVVVGWDTWVWQGSDQSNLVSGANIINGADGTATGDDIGWRINTFACSTDGTFGTFPGASTNVAGSGGYESAGRTNESSIIFSIEALTEDLNLISFHFDAVASSNTAPGNYELEVISGDITLGILGSGSIATNGGSDLFDFDFDLSGLTDNVLEQGATAAFRLTFDAGSSTNVLSAMRLDNVALTADLPIPLPVPSVELIVGYEQWSSSHARDATRANGVTAVYTDVGGSINTVGANTSGTFGTLATTPPADQTTESNGDGGRINNGGDATYQFAITNNSGIARSLGAFHFDTGTFRPNSPNAWSLTILSGSSITTGLVASGVAPNITGGTADWTEYDIYLHELADHELEDGGNVTFELSFTRSTTGGGTSGHHQFLDNVGISKIIPAPVDLDFLLGWETWSSTTPKAATTKTNDVEGSASTGGWGIDISAASTNGMWGNVITNPVADVTNDAVNDGARLTNGGEGYWDFAVTNTSAGLIDLGGFHFNSASLRPNSSRDWTLTVLAGSSITTGLVDVGTIPAPAAGGIADWYGVDIALNGLADFKLGAGEAVTFRLDFTGGVAASSGHHQFLDNVAVSTFVDTTPAVNLDSEILAFVFDPSGTSSLSFTGAVSTAYLIKSRAALTTGGFATITPSAATVGTLDGDEVTTDGTGAATAEFSESADVQFYQVESAP